MPKLSSDWIKISIHALREEGDNFSPETWTGRQLFLSTPSARRATSVTRFGSLLRINFYPRPPRGGRRIIAVKSRRQHLISIHALREEGDAIGVETHRQVTEFLSTPSARRATR